MKVSRTFASVLLAGTVFAASVAPTLAMPNNGAFSRSSEGFKTTFNDLCKHIADEIEDIEDRDSPIAPNKTRTEQNKRAADALRDKAREGGCKI